MPSSPHPWPSAGLRVLRVSRAVMVDETMARRPIHQDHLYYSVAQLLCDMQPSAFTTATSSSSINRTSQLQQSRADMLQSSCQRRARGLCARVVIGRYTHFSDAVPASVCCAALRWLAVPPRPTTVPGAGAYTQAAQRSAACSRRAGQCRPFDFGVLPPRHADGCPPRPEVLLAHQ